MTVTLAERFAQRTVFFTQVADVKFFVDDHAHFAERKWLQDVVAGSGFHGFDGGFNRAESGHHYDWQRGILVLNDVQEFQAVHARKFEVGQNKIDVILVQQFCRAFGVASRERGEAVFGEIQLKQAPHLGFVFDNQDSGHISGC
jgi:hypothetical protein